MVRQRTVKRILRRKELHEKVLQSIRESGGNFSIVSDIDILPLQLYIMSEETREKVVIYIWNVSHGGKTRDEEEYRIQLKGCGTLETSSNFKTLLLGWYEEANIFTAFDAYKHKDFGKSPSVQVKKGTLQRAMEQGVAFQTKTSKMGKDIVIAFSPPYIMEYIRHIYSEYHSGKMTDVTPREMRTIENPLDQWIPPEQLNAIPKERRIVVTTINKKVRERKFQRGIWLLYSGKCAICGLQAHLTEAAHILPVSEAGTDEIINGILLCRNHHKAFDSGLIAIKPDYSIAINRDFVIHLYRIKQNGQLREFIKNSREGQQIFLPADIRYRPSKEHLKTDCEMKGIHTGNFF